MTRPTDIHHRPAELLQHLLRFDTTNPPGREAECIGYLAGLLQSHDIAVKLLERVPGRPNLIARLEGQGNAPPLLLYGPVDVVTTHGQEWTHPPFAGDEADGYLWGRGALDMKGGVAMLVSAFLRAKAEQFPLPGDVVLGVLSDEENGGDLGARFLVQEHPDLFAGVRYAIGEFGGFSLDMAGTRFYPIMVAEKQICWIKATARASAGHGSMPIRGGAMAKAARLLSVLDRDRLPVHVTPAARAMSQAMAAALPGPMGQALGQLLEPATADGVLDRLGDRGRLFDALLHNTVSPTIIRGGDKINVIPGEVVVEMDGRLLPGHSPAELERELRALIGQEIELEIVRHDPYPSEPDMGMFETLASILREADPGGVPIPLLLPGVTDGRHFARLGIQTYGFLPMPLPGNFDFVKTIHAADERIPVGAVEFGTRAISSALRRFGAGIP
jgi:acetylornithine deacetylase/succinyl-diaminopimelate desuccinylase-like protein